MASCFMSNSLIFYSFLPRIYCERLANLTFCKYIHTSVTNCGGKLKSEWRRKKAPALTKLCSDKPEKTKTRKAFGGNRKTKITRAKEGSYILKSLDVEHKTGILDVVYNAAHKDFTSRKIIVRGTVIEIDGTPFIMHKRNNKDYIQNDDKSLVDERVNEQLKEGKVLAKVSTRPGQDGCVNGYILEGQELTDFLKMIKPL